MTDGLCLDAQPAAVGAGRQMREEAAPRRIAIICNPAAGGGRRAALVTAALAQLRAAGLRPVLLCTERTGDAEQLARHAIREGATVVVAAGGDGTLNEVINGLGDTATAVAVLPVGTTNVLASDIGLAGSPDQFASMIQAGETRPFWVGIANGRRFGIMASVGFDAQVVAGVSPRLKRLLGKGAFVLAAAQRLAAYRPSTYAVVIDGQRHEATLVVVARNRYYAGRYTIAPQARVDMGEFHVCLMAGRRRRDLLRYALAVVMGRLPRQRDVLVVRGRSITISGPRGCSEPIQADGDVVSCLPVVIAMAPSPLRLIVPHGASPEPPVAPIPGRARACPAVVPGYVAGLAG